MTRSVYLIGPPGVGKSTLMAGLLAGYTRLDPVKVPSPPRTTSLVYEPVEKRALHDTMNAVSGVSLGYRRKQFSGTDALGMSVNPQAVHWASNHAEEWDEVWGEGARLANKAFLRALDRETDLRVVELVASRRSLDLRCAERGSDQSLTWREGAATRARNLSSELMMDGIRVHTVDTTDIPAAYVLDIVKGWLR